MTASRYPPSSGLPSAGGIRERDARILVDLAHDRVTEAGVTTGPDSVSLFGEAVGLLEAAAIINRVELDTMVGYYVDLFDQPFEIPARPAPASHCDGQLTLDDAL